MLDVLELAAGLADESLAAGFDSAAGLDSVDGVESGTGVVGLLDECALSGWDA